VVLTGTGHVDFGHPPLSHDVPGGSYCCVRSLRGLAGLTVAWRLQRDEWPRWLEGKALEECLCELGGCARDDHDELGEFLLRRWPRLRRAECELGPAPPAEWQLAALTAAATGRILAAPAAGRPSPGVRVVAVAPARLREGLRESSAESADLLQPYGFVEEGKLVGGNFYGRALEGALRSLEKTESS
jgi:hypothetical protein